MIDLLAAKGAVEVLFIIASNPFGITTGEVNSRLQSRHSSLTTGTIYRRIKELELAGLISRMDINSNKVIITPKGKEILDKTIVNNRPRDEIRLKRSRRRILSILDQQQSLHITELQKQNFSPNTITTSVRELEKLGLIKVREEKKTSQIKANNGRKKKGRSTGRPKKYIELTKKGKKVLEELKEEFNL